MDIKTDLTLDDYIKRAKVREEDYQTEYWEILMDLIDANETRITDKKPKWYWVERLKELQTNINYVNNYIRETMMELAKEKLEEAFTPSIRKKLVDKMKQDIQELENE